MKPQPAAPRKTPRQGRSRYTVDVILEAATRVFDEWGYEAATTNKVAERAGVSVGSLYQYFPHKDALLTALHERHVEQVLRCVQAALREPGPGAWREQLRALVGRVVELHAECPRLQRILHVERPWLERPAAQSPGAHGLLDAMQQWLHAHSGEMTVHDEALAAKAVLRMVESMVHAAVLDPLCDLQDGTFQQAISEAVEGYLTVRRVDRP